MPGSELVLVQDWFQQYPSHSIGGLAFGADGFLYVGAGDGATTLAFAVAAAGRLCPTELGAAWSAVIRRMGRKV